MQAGASSPPFLAVVFAPMGGIHAPPPNGSPVAKRNKHTRKLGSRQWPRTTCAVQKTVAGLDGFVDGVGGVLLNLPQPVAHLGHLIAAAELDGRGGHCREETAFLRAAEWRGGEGGRRRRGKDSGSEDSRSCCSECRTNSRDQEARSDAGQAARDSSSHGPIQRPEGSKRRQANGGV